MNDPTAIADLLGTIFEQDQKWKYQLMQNWHHFFGQLSDKVYLEKIDNGTLTLAVHDACWLQELYALSDLFLAAINEKLDKPYIKRLRFIQGGKRVQPKEAHYAVATSRTEQPVTLTEKEIAALQKIKDPALAAVLRDFLVRCYRERGG